MVVRCLVEGEVFYNLMAKSQPFSVPISLGSDLPKYFLVISIPETSQEDKRRLERTKVGEMLPVAYDIRF